MASFLDHAKGQAQSHRGSRPGRMTLEQIKERYPWAEGPLSFDGKKQRVQVRCRGCGELLRDEAGEPITRATSDLKFDLRCPACEKAPVSIGETEMPYRKAARVAARAIGYNALRPGTVAEEEVEELEIAVSEATHEDFREMSLEHLRFLAGSNAEAPTARASRPSSKRRGSRTRKRTKRRATRTSIRKV